MYKGMNIVWDLGHTLYLTDLNAYYCTRTVVEGVGVEARQPAESANIIEELRKEAELFIVFWNIGFSVFFFLLI